MMRLAFILFATVGCYVLIGSIFPSTHHIAFQVMGYSISYIFILACLTLYGSVHVSK